MTSIQLAGVPVCCPQCQRPSTGLTYVDTADGVTTILHDWTWTDGVHSWPALIPEFPVDHAMGEDQIATLVADLVQETSRIVAANVVPFRPRIPVGRWHVHFDGTAEVEMHICDRHRGMGQSVRCPDDGPDGNCSHVQMEACTCEPPPPCDGCEVGG